jgi:hypothetical protein
MKRYCLAQLFLALVVLSFAAVGQQTGTALQPVSDGINGKKVLASLKAGVVIGEPTGLSAKYWVSRRNAFDLGVGWSFADKGRFDINGDYMFHPYYFPSKYGDFPVFIGGGGALRLGNNTFFGLRFPFGADYLLNRVPLTLFAQLAPIMEVAPEVDFRLEGGIGVRYAFGRSGS